MKKNIALVFSIILSISMFACQTTSNDTSIVTPTLPVIDYSSFTVDYVAIRTKDELGRTTNIEYYYDNLELTSVEVSSILLQLQNIDFNGGYGPLYGRLNDGWVSLTGEDESELILYFYLFDDFTILGLRVEDSPYEFYYSAVFDNEILAILASLTE